MLYKKYVTVRKSAFFSMHTLPFDNDENRNNFNDCLAKRNVFTERINTCITVVGDFNAHLHSVSCLNVRVVRSMNEIRVYSGINFPPERLNTMTYVLMRVCVILYSSVELNVLTL